MTVPMSRRLWLSAFALGAILVAGTACVAPPAPPGTVTVMGASGVPAATIAAWYRVNTPAPSRATVTPEALAQLYVTEGQKEGVRGDIAFAQAVVETGW